MQRLQVPRPLQVIAHRVHRIEEPHRCNVDPLVCGARDPLPVRHQVTFGSEALAKQSTITPSTTLRSLSLHSALKSSATEIPLCCAPRCMSLNSSPSSLSSQRLLIPAPRPPSTTRAKPFRLPTTHSSACLASTHHTYTLPARSVKTRAGHPPRWALAAPVPTELASLPQHV